MTRPPPSMEVAKRRAQAAELHTQGLTYRQIAEAVGVSVATAHEDVAIVRRSILREPAEEMVAVEAERLDLAFAQTWEVFEQARAGGDAELTLKAVNTWVRISESRRKLFGLDMPVKAEVSGPGGVPFVVEIPAALRVPGADTTR